MAEVGNATHFHVSRISPNWSGLMRVAHIGTHVFYRFGGGRGLPGAFIGKPTDEVLAAEHPPLMAVVTAPVPVEAAAPAKVEPEANTETSAAPAKSAGPTA